MRRNMNDDIYLWQINGCVPNLPTLLIHIVRNALHFVEDTQVDFFRSKMALSSNIIILNEYSHVDEVCE